MSLLSEAEKRSIRDAVKLVTDTFMVTPVIYHSSQPTIDEWEEDLPDETFVSYAIRGLVENPNNDGNKVKQMLEGSLDHRDVEITFNLEDLETLNLINPDYSHKFTQEADYFTMKGLVYKVTDVYTDGPLSDKDVLLVVAGKISNDGKSFDTIVFPDGNGGTTTGSIADLIAALENRIIELENEEHLGFITLPPLE